jgi:hypothetical protein
MRGVQDKGEIETQFHLEYQKGRDNIGGMGINKTIILKRV